jgi:hypothetical protein
MVDQPCQYGAAHFRRVTASVFSFLNVVNPFYIDTDVIPKNMYVRLLGNRMLKKLFGRRTQEGGSSPDRILDKIIQ